MAQIAKDHNKQIKRINYIIVSDPSLLEINKNHLGHDYFTDIITFDLSPNAKYLESDIYISADRVIANAPLYQGVEKEFLRVFFHGVLHLCGFKDDNSANKRIMREKEDHYITLYLQLVK